MATSDQGVPAVEVLLQSVVDYAGLFPPASLELADAMSIYARVRAGRDAWMLGRFVLPDTRLQEFEGIVSTVDIWPEGSSRRAQHEPWPLSVVLTAPSIDPIGLFNERGRAAIVAVELPPLAREQIGQVASQIPSGIEAFFEVSFDAGFSARVATVAAHGACVKIRTGGLDAHAFPSAISLLESMRVCADTGVALKASAGLHHALHGAYAVTHDVDSPVVEMHGFLNVVVAAALTYLGDPVAHVAHVLGETSADAFSVLPDGVAWRDRVITVEDLAKVRRRFFRSFGSCAFEEPIQDLRRLGIIA